MLNWDDLATTLTANPSFVATFLLSLGSFKVNGASFGKQTEAGVGRKALIAMDSLQQTYNQASEKQKAWISHQIKCYTCLSRYFYDAARCLDLMEGLYRIHLLLYTNKL